MDDNIIYLLILSHGLHEYNTIPYNNDSKNEIIYAKKKFPTERPTRLFNRPNVVIPDDIEYIQKITYTPFGLYNILSDNDKRDIYDRISSLVNNELIIGELLTDLVKNEVIFETIESKLVKPENPEYILNDLKLLMENRDNICQEYIYEKSINSNVSLKNKSFSTDTDDEDEEYNGIYVIRQEGGPLKVGDNILQDIININTQELLELISRHGYKKVIIIDYSCDVCTSIFGIKPDDTHINELKTQIIERKIGRGGKLKIKTKKYNRKKSILNKKYTKKNKRKYY
jgi:hypothetical protein